MVALYSGQSGQNGHFPGRAKIFFQIASVPTVIFARYLPSFCSCHFVAPFVILCYNRGKRFLISRSFSFLLFRTVAAVRNSYGRLSHPTAAYSPPNVIFITSNPF